MYVCNGVGNSGPKAKCTNLHVCNGVGNTYVGVLRKCVDIFMYVCM